MVESSGTESGGDASLRKVQRATSGVPLLPAMRRGGGKVESSTG